MNGEGYRDPTAAPAETDLECGQGCTGGFERVASGIGRDQNERQDNRKRTHMGR